MLRIVRCKCGKMLQTRRCSVRRLFCLLCSDQSAVTLRPIADAHALAADWLLKACAIPNF